MRIVALVLALFVSSVAIGQTPGNDDFYELGPDSLRHEKVPHGEMKGPFSLPSEAYAGTSHTYWVYVPAQYDAAKPAALMVLQDGHAFMDPDGQARFTNVVDNLTHRREIPVMITAFINPGRKPDQAEATASDWGDKSNNRPTEYNTLDDKYARVVCDELLPALSKDYNISKNPDDHAIGGCSSGGISAFLVAWYRPNDFRKVMTIVGSFTNIRGGHKIADMVAETEKKPIRMFMVDGRNDNRGERRGGGGYDETRDWFLQNVRLKDALVAKGYDVNYSWSINKHGTKAGGVVIPEMMRWLWRDQAVSTEVTDKVERGFFEGSGAAKAEGETTGPDEGMKEPKLLQIGR